MVSYVTPGGTITLDANLDDWHEISPLATEDTLRVKMLAERFYYREAALYATTSDTHFVFAIDATNASYRPTLWFDTDLDASTGTWFSGSVNPQLLMPPPTNSYQVGAYVYHIATYDPFSPMYTYTVAKGIDLQVRFVDRIPKLFTGDGAPVDADIQYSWNANVIEFAIERTAFGDSIEAMRVQLASFDGSYYGGYGLRPPPAYFGASGDIVLDGSAADWTAADRLDAPANGIDSFAVYGKATEHAYVFAIQSPIAIGQNTTIWLNTDNDASTGYQIWGWAGGAEYNVNFDAAGTPRLYGIDQVDDLAFAYSQDRKFVELIVPKKLIGAPAQVNALLDINDLMFLPTQYAETQYEIVDPFSDLMLA